MYSNIFWSGIGIQNTDLTPALSKGEGAKNEAFIISSLCSLSFGEGWGEVYLIYQF